jgi:hypothetical protein
MEDYKIRFKFSIFKIGDMKKFLSEGVVHPPLSGEAFIPTRMLSFHTVLEEGSLHPEAP